MINVINLIKIKFRLEYKNKLTINIVFGWRSRENNLLTRWYKMIDKGVIRID